MSILRSSPMDVTIEHQGRLIHLGESHRGACYAAIRNTCHQFGCEPADIASGRAVLPKRLKSRLFHSLKNIAKGN